MDKILKIGAELDMSKTPAKIEIMSTEEYPVPWNDLGTFLEAIAFLASVCITAKSDPRADTTEKMADYIKDYMLKAIPDYKDISPRA